MSNLKTFSAGFIIVHEPDFWRRPPPQRIPPILPPRPPIPPRPMLGAAWSKSCSNKNNYRRPICHNLHRPGILQSKFTTVRRYFHPSCAKGATINKFSMKLTAKKWTLNCLIQKARQIYEDIVAQTKRLALARVFWRRFIQVRVFPIEPNAQKRISLSYSQCWNRIPAGLINYLLPLRAGKYSSVPIKNISLKIESFKSPRSLKSIYSPSHKVEIKRDGEKMATIGYEESNVKAGDRFSTLFSLGRRWIWNKINDLRKLLVKMKLFPYVSYAFGWN